MTRSWTTLGVGTGLLFLGLSTACSTDRRDYGAGGGGASAGSPGSGASSGSGHGASSASSSKATTGSNAGGATGSTGTGGSGPCGHPGEVCCEPSAPSPCVGTASCSNGVCLCPSGLTECNGACFDTTKDDKNCGPCGHDCLGGACLSSACQPVDVATNQGRTFMLQVDANFVYWGGDFMAISKRAKDLSSPSVVLAPSEIAYSWALDGQYVYWANDWNDKAIRKCALPACTGGVTTMQNGTDNFRSMTMDPSRSTLFFRRTTGTQIMKMPLPAGAATSIGTTSTTTAAELTADANFVYFGEQLTPPPSGTFHLAKVSQNGGNIVALAYGAAVHFPDAIAVSGSTVYWAQDNGIFSAPLPAGIGASAPPLFASTSGSSSVLTVAADATNVYWGDRVAGTVNSCPKAGCGGGGQKVLAAGQGKVWSVIYDAQAIYWVTEEGLVRYLAK